MSSKKSLLSKLKKNIEARRNAADAQEANTTSNDLELNVRVINQNAPASTEAPSRQDRYLEFIGQLQVLLRQTPVRRSAIQDCVRLFLSFFPEEQIFHHLLSLDDARLQEFVEKSLQDPMTNILEFLKKYLNEVHSSQKQDHFDVLLAKLREIPDDSKSFANLLALDAFIFEPLEFEPVYNNFMAPSLVDMILELPISSPSQVKHHVELFLYRHRFDYVLEYLQNPNISIPDKNKFTRESIEESFENVRSKHLFIQLMNLIDERKNGQVTTPFQKPLQSILYRFIEEKQMIPSLRNYLEIILDVVIHNPSDKALEKYFPSKAKLEAFKNKMYPLLQSEKNYSFLIRARCIEEFDQSYVYKHAKEVGYEMYVQSIEKHFSTPISSIEMDLYDRLHKNTQVKLEQILTMLNTTGEVDRAQLNVLLPQFIATQPYRSRIQLEKLMTLPTSQVRHILQNYQVQEYVDVLKNISTFHKKQDVLLSEPSKINYIEFTNDSQEIVERTRPYLPYFDHVAISPLKEEDLSMYILRPDGSSTTYFLPNERFYQHLVDAKIPKAQKDSVFVMNGIPMKLANVSIYQDYAVQDEDVFAKGQQYMQQQRQLESMSSPVSFFVQFCQMPVLNHQSQFMENFREKNRVMIASALSQNDIDPRTTMAQEIELSIYNHTSNLGRYSDLLSILLTLLSTCTSTLSTFSQHVKTLLRTNRLKLSEIGMLLDMGMDTVITLLFPEITHAKEGSTILKSMFLQDIALTKRRIILDAYASTFPMRRIPYLPVNPAMRQFRTDLIVLETEMTSYVIPDEFENFFQTPDVIAQGRTVEGVVSTPNVDDVIFEEHEENAPNDPLAYFIETAFEELYNL